MLYRSTRGASPSVLADKALRAGAAPDGGLYLPDALPALELDQSPASLSEVARQLLPAFFADSALVGAVGADRKSVV